VSREDVLWNLLGHLHELHDAASKGRVRAGRRAFRRAVQIVLELIDFERSRRS
jgi:hypothetical protein